MEYTPALKEKYKKEIVPALTKEYNYGTVMQVPRLVKITLNQGLCQILCLAMQRPYFL